MNAQYAQPILGQHLRAARAGFYWLPSLGCYARVRIHSERSWMVTLCGNEGIPARPDANANILWQDGGLCAETLAESQAIQRVAAELEVARKDHPGAARAVEICDHGEALSEACAGCKRAALPKPGAKP